MNESNTSMGTVPGTTQGAGALAPAPEELTIDKRDLRGLWLPAERIERESYEYLWRCFMKARVGSLEFRALNVAVSLVGQEWRKTVRAITDRGGLLFVGVGG